MSSETSRNFIFEFFARIGTIPGGTEQEKMACDYLQAGLLDSFGVVELIMEIEEKLNINLQSEDLENPKFKIVGGLIEILDSKLNNN